MKVVIQRSKESSVSVDGKIINKIDGGLMILVGINEFDNEEDVDYIVKKTLNLRIFDDENGVMNKSILDVVLPIFSTNMNKRLEFLVANSKAGEE